MVAPVGVSGDALGLFGRFELQGEMELREIIVLTTPDYELSGYVECELQAMPPVVGAPLDQKHIAILFELGLRETDGLVESKHHLKDIEGRKRREAFSFFRDARE
ncbi:MAG: hypothetical protein AAFQ82_10710 [Myxococcota bacterium]